MMRSSVDPSTGAPDWSGLLFLLVLVLLLSLSPILLDLYGLLLGG